MNKLTATMGGMLLPLVLGGCQDTGQSSDKVIGKPEIQVIDGKVTAEVLEAFGRISSPLPSPDGSKIIFLLAYESIEENKSNSEIYSMDADGSNMKRLTETSSSESNIRWIDNGNKIAYLRKDDKTGKVQLHIMNADGSGVKCLSDVQNGIESFEISPDETKIIFSSTIAAYNKDEDLFKGLDKTSGRVVNDLMYKHWD